MAKTLILLAVRVGVLLTVFALGLAASKGDVAYLFRRPRKLGKALLSMNVIMPLAALAMVSLFDLHPAVAVAMIALSVAPIPPVVPRKALKAGGGAGYTIGLLVAASVFAIVFVPVAVALLASVFGKAVRVPPERVATVVALTVLAPLAAGLIAHRLAPRFAERAAAPISVIGLVLLVAGSAPVLVVEMPTIVTLIGNGTVVALAAFVVLGLAAGHLLGGPDADERFVLALTTSSRHPGVAFVVIASAGYSDQKLLIAALLLYLLVNAIVTLPYVAWSKRHHAKVAHPLPT